MVADRIPIYKNDIALSCFDLFYYIGGFNRIVSMPAISCKVAVNVALHSLQNDRFIEMTGKRFSSV